MRWSDVRRTCLDAALAAAPRSIALWRRRTALAAEQRDAPALLNGCRNLAALAPGDVESIERWAALELASGNLDGVRSALRAANAAGAADLRLVRSSLMDPDRAQAGAAYVAVLEHVEVETADWSILDGEKVYNFEAHKRALGKNPFVGFRMSPDRKAFLMKLPQPSRAVDEPCVHLGGDGNYAHWVMRNLLKLALLEGTPYETLPLIVNDDLKPWQVQYLSLLGIGDERLIRLPRPAVVGCRKLVVPTNLVNTPHIMIGVEWLRRRLASYLDTRAPSRLLFIGRRDASVRRLVNEDALERALTALGFEAMVPAALSAAEQIAQISGARVIVGVHGAALANLVFAPAGASVIEINSGYKSHMIDFAFLSRAMGLDHTAIVSEDYAASSAAPLWADVDFRVDVEEVVRTLYRVAPDLGARGAPPPRDSPIR